MMTLLDKTRERVRMYCVPWCMFLWHLTMLPSTLNLEEHIALLNLVGLLESELVL
jgi:hypothetical protein